MEDGNRDSVCALNTPSTWRTVNTSAICSKRIAVKAPIARACNEQAYRNGHDQKNSLSHVVPPDPGSDVHAIDFRVQQITDSLRVFYDDLSAEPSKRK